LQSLPMQKNDEDAKKLLAMFNFPFKGENNG